MDVEAYKRIVERLGLERPAAAVPEDPAEALLDRLLAEGATFEVLSGELVWFGPASTVAPEIRSRVAELKPGLIALLQGARPRSRRTWGEPSRADWDART